MKRLKRILLHLTGIPSSSKKRRIYNLLSETDSLNWLVWEEYFSNSQLGPKSAILDPATSIKFVVTLENAGNIAGNTMPETWLSALISCATLEFTRPEPRHSRQDSAPAVTSVGVLCLYILYYLLFNLLFFGNILDICVGLVNNITALWLVVFIH